MDKPKNTKQQKTKEGFFKRYWHIIVIIVLLLFAMSQCTKSCSRNQKISGQNKEMLAKDSIIDNLSLQVDTLKNSLNYYVALYNAERSHNSDFTSIATGNQNELYTQITDLNAKIVSLQNESIVLNNKIKSLNKENGVLKDSLLYYKSTNKNIE